MRFPFFRNRDSVKNGILISIRRTGDGFHPGLFNKGKKKFKAYLYTIANHLCIDESRKVEFYPLEDEENIVHEYNDIVRLEDRAEISYFLNFLSSEQREAVILRFGEQLSFGEIAKVMGCNMRTAQSRVRNALKIMRKEQENER